MDVGEQYNKIYRYYYMKTRDHPVSEDLTQETFLRFLENHSYREMEKIINDEDAVQSACAARIKANYIVTRNIKDFTESKVDTTGMDCRRALSSALHNYENAIMVESAIRGGMDCIVMRNLKDYQSTSIPVFFPQDFVNLLLPSEE